MQDAGSACRLVQRHTGGCRTERRRRRRQRRRRRRRKEVAEAAEAAVGGSRRRPRKEAAEAALSWHLNGHVRPPRPLHDHRDKDGPARPRSSAIGRETAEKRQRNGREEPLGSRSAPWETQRKAEKGAQLCVCGLPFAVRLGGWA